MLSFVCQQFVVMEKIGCYVPRSQIFFSDIKQGKVVQYNVPQETVASCHGNATSNNLKISKLVQPINRSFQLFVVINPFELLKSKCLHFDVMTSCPGLSLLRAMTQVSAKWGKVSASSELRQKPTVVGSPVHSQWPVWPMAISTIISFHPGEIKIFVLPTNILVQVSAVDIEVCQLLVSQ